MYTPNEDLIVEYVSQKLKSKYGENFDPNSEISDEDKKELIDELSTMNETN